MPLSGDRHEPRALIRLITARAPPADNAPSRPPPAVGAMTTAAAGRRRRRRRRFSSVARAPATPRTRRNIAARNRRPLPLLHRPSARVSSFQAAAGCISLVVFPSRFSPERRAVARRSQSAFHRSHLPACAFRYDTIRFEFSIPSDIRVFGRR